MASPMYDVGDHFPITVTEAGGGPADNRDTVDIVCWCSDASCEQHLEDLERLRPNYPSEETMLANRRRIEKDRKQ